MPKLTTTIEVGYKSAHIVYFEVTRSHPDDKKTPWVTNKVYDADDNLIGRQDAVVLWGGASSLEGHTDNLPVSGGVRGVAYVTTAPWRNRETKTRVEYTVGG